MSYFTNYMNISETVGFVFTKIEYIENDREIIFTRDNGKRYSMQHEQDCCEDVFLSDVIGDLEDLVNTPILKAEESSEDGDNDGSLWSDLGDSSTWTFYKFATRKGYVDLRWFGSSNGYYSESVSFGEIEE